MRVMAPSYILLTAIAQIKLGPRAKDKKISFALFFQLVRDILGNIDRHRIWSGVVHKRRL